MKQFYWLASLFCCLVLTGLIHPVTGRGPNRRRRKRILTGDGDCLHKVPNANTKYVPVLNPGVPVNLSHNKDALHIIDVMLIYTKAARISRGGNSLTLLSDAAALVAKTNIIYKSSKIPARLNLVYTTQAAEDYFEANTISEDLNRLTAGDDGYLDEVHNLRQCVGADLVILLTSVAATNDDKNLLGAAWFRTNSPAFDGTSFAPFAFAVVRYNIKDAAGDDLILNRTAKIFAHQIGHLAGCLHDVDSHSSAELSLMRKPYALGYSFKQDTLTYRSIMSVKSGAKRIDFHSNPQVLFQTTSQALGNITQANAALFLSQEFTFLEAFLAGPSADFCPADLVGCDGKSLSGVRIDRCGICGGNDACVDCDDMANGGKKEDCLGVCGGSAVIDCLDICNGAAQIDCSDVCNGGHIEDCAGVCGGEAVNDCNLVCHGTAFVDDCGVCVSGKTDKIPNVDKDCLGVCGGIAVFDECDICDGDGSSCVNMCNCPMPPDYWKTHNCFAPVPARQESWPGVYKDCLELVRCENGFGLLRWLDVLHAPHNRNNAWLTLGKHWIAARLNLAYAPCLSEVDLTSRKELTEAMDSAQNLLEITSNQKSCENGEISILSGNSADGLSALALTTVIGRFNERVEFSDSICQRTAMPNVEPERCEGGCTRVAEYWSTYHSKAMAPSLRKPWPAHAETQQMCHGDAAAAGPQKLDILLIPKSLADAWTILAQQIIVTELNIAADACIPKEVADTVVFSRSVLGTQCSAGSKGHQQQDSLKKDMLGLASILEAYNRGELGPGECGILTPLVLTDPWEMAASTACEIGCVHSGAYWATHHIDAKREELRTAWPKVDQNMGPEAPATESTSLCHQQPTEISWLSLMLMTDGSSSSGPDQDIWFSLAQEWIAARLNTYSGACTTQSVLNALLLGTQILEINCENKLAKDEGASDAAMEIIHVLSEYNVGCGGRGPAKCQGENSEMQSLVINGLEAVTRLARHEEACIEYTESECKSEKELSDKYLTWAVIVTLLLGVTLVLLLFLLLWWWLQARKAERRLARRIANANKPPTTATTTTHGGARYDSVSVITTTTNSNYGTQPTRRNTTHPNNGIWP